MGAGPKHKRTPFHLRPVGIPPPNQTHYPQLGRQASQPLDPKVRGGGGIGVLSQQLLNSIGSVNITTLYKGCWLRPWPLMPKGYGFYSPEASVSSASEWLV